MKTFLTEVWRRNCVFSKMYCLVGTRADFILLEVSLLRRSTGWVVLHFIARLLVLLKPLVNEVRLPVQPISCTYTPRLTSSSLLEEFSGGWETASHSCACVPLSVAEPGLCVWFVSLQMLRAMDGLRSVVLKALSVYVLCFICISTCQLHDFHAKKK